MRATSSRILLLTSLLLLLQHPPLLANEADVRAGQAQHEQLLKTIRLYQDPVLNAYVNEVGQKLAANSKWPDISWHFFIVDDGSINAFATRGGYVYMHRGLMTYLTSEAQLAAVLSHEIAHITERHLARQRSSANLGRVMSVVASIAVWNSNVGSAIDIWNAARISGYGREMELEADQVGAGILYRSGYDPQAIIEVLSLMKDHEGFSSRRSGGGYHGVFATHTSSDQRLQEVVAQAGQLPPGEAFRGRDEYRRHLDGVVFGENQHANAPPGYQRFTHRGLGITLLYPENWTSSIDGNRVRFASPNAAGGMDLVVEALQDLSVHPEQLLKDLHQIQRLQRPGPLYPDEARRDEATQALLDTSAGKRRIAAVKLSPNVFYFTSDEDAGSDSALDEQYQVLMQSFRQARQEDYPQQRVLRINYRRLEPGETFADLARETPALGQEAEQYLRLINGYYPRGEAQPGTWIKLVN